MVTAAAAWSIWGSDIFPPEPDPTGGMQHDPNDSSINDDTFSPIDPEKWTENELRRWLQSVRHLVPAMQAIGLQLNN